MRQIKKRINIFDFDGTLYRNPHPNPAVHPKKVLGKIMNTYQDGGYGWFQNPVTLSPDYAKPDKFIPTVVKAAKESLSDEEAVTVLLTGRCIDYIDHITNLLATQDLAFDRVILKPTAEHKTFDYKKEVVENLLEEFPYVNELTLWDDRDKQVEKFAKWADSYKTDRRIKCKIKHVKFPDFFLPEKDELALLEILKADPRFIPK